MDAWNIFLNGDYLDTVFYSKNLDSDYVKRSLIDHDGYSEAIEIKIDKKVIVTTVKG